RDAVERDGTLVLSMAAPASSSDLLERIASETMLTGFEQRNGGPETWRPLSKWLLSTRRVILSVVWSNFSETAKAELVDLMKKGVKVIVEAPGALPQELFVFIRNKKPGSLEGTDPANNQNERANN